MPERRRVLRGRLLERGVHRRGGGELDLRDAGGRLAGPGRELRLRRGAVRVVPGGGRRRRRRGQIGRASCRERVWIWVDEEAERKKREIVSKRGEWRE